MSNMLERIIARRFNHKKDKPPRLLRLYVSAERSRDCYKRICLVDVYLDATLIRYVEIFERARDPGVLAANEQLTERPPQ
jgi:hypothetical protein